MSDAASLLETLAEARGRLAAIDTHALDLDRLRTDVAMRMAAGLDDPSDPALRLRLEARQAALSQLRDGVLAFARFPKPLRLRHPTPRFVPVERRPEILAEIDPSSDEPSVTDFGLQSIDVDSLSEDTNPGEPVLEAATLKEEYLSVDLSASVEMAAPVLEAPADPADAEYAGLKEIDTDQLADYVGEVIPEIQPEMLDEPPLFESFEEVQVEAPVFEAEPPPPAPRAPDTNTRTTIPPEAPARNSIPPRGTVPPRSTIPPEPEIPIVKDRNTIPPPAAAINVNAPAPARPVGPQLAAMVAEEEDEEVEMGEAGEDFDEDGDEGFGVQQFSRTDHGDEEESPSLTNESDGPPGFDDEPADMGSGDLRPLENLDKSQVGPLLHQARSNLERGDLAAAALAFTDLLDIVPDHTEALLGRGRCYLDLGDYAAAMSDFQKAEDLDPRGPEPLVAMGELFFARKEYTRAIEFFDSAIQLADNHAMARCRRGISYYYKKNYRQAFLDLQKAYNLDPEIPNIRKYVQMAIKKLEKSGEGA